jgi:hypothetical protein
LYSHAISSPRVGRTHRPPPGRACKGTWGHTGMCPHDHEMVNRRRLSRPGPPRPAP